MRTIVLLALAGCGSHGNPVGDAFGGSPIPPTITISGTATMRAAGGAQPVAGLAVSAYVYPDTLAATATTDSTGAYHLVVPTHGEAVDATVETTAGTYVATYRYLPPIASDRTGAALDMMTPAAYAAAYTTIGVTQQPGSAMLELIADDIYGGPVMGATFTALTGTVAYTANGVIDRTATRTDAEGVGFVLDATSDNQVQATSSSVLYPEQSVTGVAGALAMSPIYAELGGD